MYPQSHALHLDVEAISGILGFAPLSLSALAR